MKAFESMDNLQIFNAEILRQRMNQDRELIKYSREQIKQSDSRITKSYHRGRIDGLKQSIKFLKTLI